MRHMTLRLTAIIFGLSVLPVFADTATNQPVQTTTTEHVAFAPGGTIRVNDSVGYLTVEGWDQPEVEITVVKSVGYDTEPAAQATQRLESVHVATEHVSGSELAISTTHAGPHSRFHNPFGKDRAVMVEYRIRAPRNSHIAISHADGYVSVTGMTGNIEATSRRGDIVLMLPDLTAYAIDAHTKAGVVTADVAGATRRKRVLGETFSHGDASMAHKLSLQMGFGGITIKELPPESLTPAGVVAR